ncbi:hypothetical protein [Bacillus sp. CH_442]|uniref:hypothetical protein n=1 Tax=Bacillus sp. CH_442 TaxID=2978217 RepID=UPI0030F52E78|nr:hypothetical protein [Bacillus thuringiensis]
MNIVKEDQKSHYFFDSFFKNHPIENDIFVIEANEKYFFFEHDTVIDMIKNFTKEDQDYIRRLVGRYKKGDCKILPLQSIIHCN